MKRLSVPRVISIVAILFAVCVLAVPTLAQETVVTDTFDDPQLPGWERSGNAAVMDGVLLIEPGDFAFLVGEWGDLALTVEVRVPSDAEAVISYCHTEADRYTLLLGPGYGVLGRDSGGTSTEIATGPAQISPGQWAEIQVAMSGETHEVAVNGQPVLAGTDSDPLPPGAIGLGFQGLGRGEFDNLVLTAIGEAPPPAEVSPMPEPTPVVETPPPAEPSPEAAPPPSGAGPAYQAESWTFMGGPPGGIGYDIRHSFSDADTWYVTDTASGIHISTDRGLTWRQSNTGIRQGASFGYRVFSVTVDPHNSDIIWIGTRDAGHIYRSADGGLTWEERTANASSGPAVAYRGFTVDPRSSDIVYAMAEVTDWVFRDEGELSEYDLSHGDYAGGRIFKTEDAGLTWTRIWQGPALNRYLWINPDQPDELYASTGIFDRQALDFPGEGADGSNCGGVGILKSTDGGQRWDVIGFEEGLTSLTIGSLFMHPGDPQILLAGGGSDMCPFGPDTGTERIPRYGGAYLTTDGGRSWETVISNDIITSVEFCAADPQIAYAAGLTTVYRSEDGGHTWQEFGDPERRTWGPPGLNPGTPIDIQTDPADCYRVFINNYDGGNFVSTDGGETWADASQGYSGAVIWGLYVDPTNPMRVLVGAGIAPWVSEDGGLTWRGLSNGELTRGAIALEGDPNDPNHFLAQMGSQVIPLGGVYETTDGGQYWTKVFELPRVGTMMRFMDFAFAPSNGDVVYGATLNLDEFPELARESDPHGMGVYRSTDGGTTWQPPADEKIANRGFKALAVSPTDPNTVYAGSFFNQGLFKSVDGGVTWAPINEGLTEPYGSFSALAVDPTDSNLVYAGGSAGLFKSSNAGGSWEGLAAGLDPAGIVSDIVIDPTSPNVVYVGTYNLGVYYSTDSGEHFQKLSQGLEIPEGAHLRIFKLRLSSDGTVLYAGTGGVGVLRLGPSTGGASRASPTAQVGTVIPADTAAEAASTSVPEAPGGGGICPGAAALPLTLLGLVWISRRKK
jgi:photosystem II stability/assembly factor-like uncharacterized protein